MHPWEKAYKENKFEITTLQPSVVVKSNEEIFLNGTNVFDIGCGNGRNAIFLARKGCFIDAVDVAYTGWLSSLKPSIKKLINFQKTDIDDFSWEDKKYDVILLLRIIQYLSPAQLENLMGNIQTHLAKNGVLLMSYTEKGGIQNRLEINVLKFSHSIKFIKKLLKGYFNQVHIADGATRSMHVKYNEPIKSYDIKCLI